MNTLWGVAAVAGTCALCGAVPGSAAAQGGLLGGVGSIVGGTTDTLTSTLEQVLGGGDATLPTAELGGVLVNVVNPPGAPGALPGSSSSSTGGSARLVGGGVAAPGVPASDAGGLDDGRAPVATVRVVSRLKNVARTRRLRVEVRSDEAGVVAFTATVRPGLKRRGVARRITHRRSVIHLPPVALAFRRPGTLTVDLRLKASEAAKLGRSRNGRMSIGLLTADVARNQATERLKRHLRR